jgi:hypothetical protein
VPSHSCSHRRSPTSTPSFASNSCVLCKRSVRLEMCAASVRCGALASLACMCDLPSWALLVHLSFVDGHCR